MCAIRSESGQILGTVDDRPAISSSISRRERIALAARVLLDEAEINDQELSILLRALARREADVGKSSSGNSSHSGGECQAPAAAKLSPRRCETLDLLMRGLSEKEVAQRMQLTRATVHEHVKRIYRAMRVHSRSELLSMVLGQAPNGRQYPK